MKHLFNLRCLLWIAGVATFTACTDDENLLLNAKPAFDVTLDGKSILDTSTPQSIEFGRSIRFDMVCENVAYLEAIAPEGWNCALIVSENYLTVNAPAYDNLEAEPSGTVTFKVFDAKGINTDYTLPVEAFESDMTVTIAEDISERQIFGLGKSKTYTYTLNDSAEKLSLSLPGGWSSQIGEQTFTVTAPNPDAEEFTEEGSVIAAAVSPRGTKGEPVRIDVAISRAVPSIVFEHSTYSLHYGETLDIPFTASEVASVIPENVPAGWTVNADLENSKLVVTAPSKDAGTSRGTIDLLLKSEAELQETSALTLRLYGIGSIDDFKALREAIESESPDLTPYLVDGEVTLTSDIPVTDDDLIYCEGSAGSAPTDQARALLKTFAGYGLNGNGYALDLSINVNCKKFALFYKIGSVSSTTVEKVDPLTKIHDLTLRGNIYSNYTTTAKSQGMLLGTIACYNNGAELYNLTSSVTITHERSDFGSENDDKLKQGIIGGLVAQDQFGSPTYRNCCVSGAISTKGGIQNLGGLVGYMVVNTSNDYGTFTYTDCEHTGHITVTQTAGRHSDGYIGGIIGCSHYQQPVLTNCVNRGDITIDLQNGSGSIQGCGGLIGSGYGILTSCQNYGNITALEYAFTSTGGRVNRRYGGLIGGPGKVSTKDQTDTRNFRMELTDCTNYGNIKVSSSMIGGLIGFSEKNWRETGILHNCVNEGNIETSEPCDDIGGLIGRSSGVDLFGCTNRGTIKGACSRSASGLIGVVSWSDKNRTYTIDGCVSEGDILLSGNVASDASKGAVVQVSGLLGIYYTTSVPYHITNCRVSCRIQADNANINLLWGGYNGGKVDLFEADDYTKNNSEILQ